MKTDLPEGRAAPAPHSPLKLLRSVAFSPTTTAAMFYAVMGLGFSGAHLLLAKYLPALEYAEISLAIAVVNLTKEFSPLGAQGVILRHRLHPDRAMLVRVASACAFVGVLVAACAARIYHLGTITAVLLAAGILASGVTYVAAAFFQSRQVFLPAMFLSQSSNLVLLAGAVAVIFLPRGGTWLILAITVLGYVVSAAWSWSRLLGGTRGPGPADTAVFSWREALSYTIVSGAVPMLVQSERLFIPKLLSLEDLATFGVLAAIVLSPYKTLQVGVGFTTLPRLRAAETARERRRLLAREAWLLAVFVVGGGLVLAWLTPVLVKVVFQGKYEIGPGLIWAALAVGGLRTYGGLSKAAAMALCTTRELGFTSGLVWLAVGVALAGSVVGASWGLTGLVVGIAAGWVTLLAAYAVPAARHLRD